MAENPYQTPETAAAREGAVVSMSAGSVRSLEFLARFSKSLLCVYIIFSVGLVAYLNSIAERESIHSYGFTNVSIKYYSAMIYSLVFSAIFYILVALVISLWTMKAMLDVWVFAENKPKITPGWAGLWYFVPVCNVWKPYQVMIQIWVSTFQEGKRKWMVLIWWVSWLCSLFCSYLTYRLWYSGVHAGYGEGSLGLQRGVLGYTVASSVLAIASASCLIYIISKISQAHQSRIIAEV